MSIWSVLKEFWRNAEARGPAVGSFDGDKGEYLGDGVYVWIRSYYGCVYTEHDHVICFGVAEEPNSDEQIIYNLDLRRWQPPHDEEPISEQKVGQIVANIQKSFRGPFVDRGVRPHMPVPDRFPRRWVVWTKPPMGPDRFQPIHDN